MFCCDDKRLNLSITIKLAPYAITICENIRAYIFTRIFLYYFAS